MFEQTLIAVVVGWSLGTASTWLILSKPWLDKRLLAKKPVVQIAQQNQQVPAQVKIV
jgi:uncharacterized membrane protein YciS (DUF1049 family)